MQGVEQGGAVGKVRSLSSDTHLGSSPRQFADMCTERELPKIVTTIDQNNPYLGLGLGL